MKKNANTMRPGLPGYTGPVTGTFALLHHGVLFEWSHDVTERVTYVRRVKRTIEVPIRLRHMLYLGGCRERGMVAYGKAGAAYDKAREAYGKARAANDKAWESLRWAVHDKASHDKAREAVDRAWEAYGKAREAVDREGAAYDKAWEAVDQAAVLAYIRKHVPDCRWDGKELLFN